MNSYAYWDTYLNGGRNKNERPINGSRTKRAFRKWNGDIALRLHYTDVVTLHADGTETINTGGWHTVTTMRFLSEHSRARVYSEKYQLFVRTNSPTYTAPRVSKCRRCKNGRVPQSCYGPGWCYVDYWRPVCEHGETVSHKRAECSHGATAAHALPSVECWQCHGEGRYDYGSKEVHYRWDGGPLRIDSFDGYPIAGGETVTTVKAVESGSKSYGDSGDLLKSVIPALSISVQCPHCTDVKVSLESVVIHLNDSAKWTREQVADWLDTLNLDLTFPVPDHIPAHIN